MDPRLGDVVKSLIYFCVGLGVLGIGALIGAIVLWWRG